MLSFRCDLESVINERTSTPQRSIHGFWNVGLVHDNNIHIEYNNPDCILSPKIEESRIHSSIIFEGLDIRE